MQGSIVTFRVKKILMRMCNESDYVTLASIAKELNISTKTVLRELPEVERWLEEYGCRLDKKTGAGVRITGAPENRNKVVEALKAFKDELIYSPYERRTLILYELLQGKEPVKLYSFTRALKVTESTISNDLDKAEEWFRNHRMKLIRKPGLGVFLEGSENDRRSAIAALIHESVAEEDLLDFVRTTADEVEDLVLNLIDKGTIKKLEEIVYQVQKEMTNKLADSSVVALIVHLALVIKRMSMGEGITLEQSILTELMESPEFTVAKRLQEEIFQSFGITMPDVELCYIVMHLKGSKNMEFQSKGQFKPLGNFELVRMTKEIIRVAEQETGSFLEQDERLLGGLVNHLGPALNRLRLNMEIRNPLLENIKNHYPDLMLTSEKCIKGIEMQLGIRMPEAEIAYIAMHLGAALENQGKTAQRTFRVVLACSAGIGTSMILATRLVKEFPDLQVMDTISTLRIEEDWLRDEGIDFIVSTVKLERTTLPVVTVNPLLFEEDKLRIREQIKCLSDENQCVPVRKKRDRSLKEQLERLGLYSQGILEVLDGFFLGKEKEFNTLDEIVSQIVWNIFGDMNPEDGHRLSESLKQREERGGIVITGHHTLLFHCRTEVVDRLYFGAFQLKNEMSCRNGRDEEEPINLAVIMLAPQSVTKEGLEVISHVSKMLIERPHFMETLRKGDREDALQELSWILKTFYKGKV